MSTTTTGTHRPTVAEVDLGAVRDNVRALQPATAQLMAVVKADGYGHGAAHVARAALEAGATWLGVALVEEGVELREAGIDAPILVLSEFPEGASAQALAAGLTPTVYTDRGLREIADARRGSGIHLKVDTGMHRVGASPQDALLLAAAALEAGLEVEGVWTHFARSEELDDPTTDRQLERFLGLIDELGARGIRPRLRHAANSGAAIGRAETHLDMVRTGIAIYGIAPGPQVAGLVTLRPAMRLRSRVSLVRGVAAGEGISYGHRYHPSRATTIATVPVGYADGYRRALTAEGQVLIRGRRMPVAGTVTMDQLMVDCGDQPVESGDEVVLMGTQGDEEIRAEELAAWAGTIGYEIVTGIGPRVPREYP
jgi:alanine racemase